MRLRSDFKHLIDEDYVKIRYRCYFIYKNDSANSIVFGERFATKKAAVQGGMAASRDQRVLRTDIKALVSIFKNQRNIKTYVRDLKSLYRTTINHSIFEKPLYNKDGYNLIYDPIEHEVILRIGGSFDFSFHCRYRAIATRCMLEEFIYKALRELLSYKTQKLPGELIDLMSERCVHPEARREPYLHVWKEFGLAMIERR